VTEVNEEEHVEPATKGPKLRVVMGNGNVDVDTLLAFYRDRLNGLGEYGARVVLARYSGDSTRRPNADPQAPSS